MSDAFQRNAFQGNAFQTGAPPTSGPGTDNLLANDVESASSVSQPALTQVHVLNANDVQSASGVSIPVLRQVHVILANDVQSASQVSIPALAQVHALLANDVQSASELTKPALAEIGSGTDVLLAQDVEAASQLSRPVLAIVGAGGTGSAALGGGAFALSDRDIERIQRALFPEDYPKKRKKKQIIRLEKLATEILNEFRPVDLPPYDMELVRRAVEAINMPVKVIREKPRIAVEALLAEAQRLAIEEDDEEVIALFLAA